jgi:hypothetical protein
MSVPGERLRDANPCRTVAVMDDHVGMSRVAVVEREFQPSRSDVAAGVIAAPPSHRSLAAGAEIRG